MEPKLLLECLDLMRLTRLVEEKVESLSRTAEQGFLVGRVYRSLGQEAVAVASTLALGKEPGDWIIPSYRESGIYIARGIDPVTLFCQFFGRDASPTKGRESGIHIADHELGLVGLSSHLGALVPVANGLAWAMQHEESADKAQDKHDRVVLVYFGEGTSAEGVIHDAVNAAAVFQLPIVYIVVNNQWAISTPQDRQMPITNLAARFVSGYGIPTTSIDGNDARAVYDAALSAIEHARQGKGPQAVVCLTMRMTGHATHDRPDYLPEDALEHWRQRDPIALLARHIMQEGIATQETLDERYAALKIRVDDAAAYAKGLPPASYEHLESDIFIPSAVKRASTTAADPAKHLEERSYAGAIQDGLAVALREDPRTCIFGEDVGAYGGVFTITQGLQKTFGEDRVFDTPLSENAIIGHAIGAAIAGRRPVAEIQFADFLTVPFSLLVDVAAKYAFRFGVPLPLVVRAPYGGGTGSGPFHSSCPEAWFINNVHGFKIVIPSTPYDAKGLLLASIEDPNPVLFFEHKALYFLPKLKEGVPEGHYTVPIGKGVVRREGTDATVVTWGAMVHLALEAAEHLSATGKSVEVIDLRTLVPLDWELIAASVTKTNRILVLHEAPLTGGFGAEIAARIGEELFEELDAPLTRLASLDIPVPASRDLEQHSRPTIDKIEAALRKLLNY